MTKNSNFRLNLSSKAVVKTLVILTIGLLLIHLVLQFFYHVLDIELASTLRGRFDVDNEISIPTWFSQMLLLIPAVLAFAAYKLDKDTNPYWILLALLLLFLSIDEGAMLHEAFITKFREWSGSENSTGLAHHTWLLPIGVVFAGLLIPFVKFIRRLPRQTALWLGSGLGLYVFGAIIYETLGLMYAPGGFWYEGLNVAIEESLEMFGAIIIIYSLLNYLKNRAGKIEISL